MLLKYLGLLYDFLFYDLSRKDMGQTVAVVVSTGFFPLVLSTVTQSNFFFLSIPDTFFLNNVHNSIFIFLLMIPFNMEGSLLMSSVVIFREFLFYLLAKTGINIFYAFHYCLSFKKYVA